jgi:hypothetical protein
MRPPSAVAALVLARQNKKGRGGQAGPFDVTLGDAGLFRFRISEPMGPAFDVGRFDKVGWRPAREIAPRARALARQARDARLNVRRSVDGDPARGRSRPAPASRLQAITIAEASQVSRAIAEENAHAGRRAANA